MAVLHKSKRLKKELTLLNVYTIATGATLSSGFFLLPGLAAAQAGPAVILSYLVAAVHLVPAMFCMAELSTAMPRAGGIYYFLDRSMGPLLGTIGGLGTWLALILKTAFALIGMGAYVSLFFPEMPIVPLAVGFAILFGGINLFGAKKTGGLQILLVVGLLLLLSAFTGFGVFHVNADYFSGFFDSGFDSIYSTAGLVYISYVGLTNVASVSEEVKNPERNLWLGMLFALITAVLVYGLGTFVMVGVLSPEQLYNNLTPVASAAKTLVGPWGAVLMTVAAVLAFLSVANAAILSASRYPLAMSRDHLIPRLFRTLNKHDTPQNAIFITVSLIILCLIFLNPIKIAKLASSFQLLLFAMCCLAVIIMRESRIESYDPGFRSPLYPWMQIFGIAAPLLLIFEMGWWPILFTGSLIVLGAIWYFYYAKEKVVRDGAIYHIFARLGTQRFEGLDRELRGILIEKGLREDDPFDVVVTKAGFIDLPARISFEEVVHQAAFQLSHRLPASVESLKESFMQGTKVGATPVSHGVALPHLRFPEIDSPEMVIVRAKEGVHVEVDNVLLVEHTSDKPVYAFFFLVSPEGKPAQHLRILAQIAGHVDDDQFMERWLSAGNEQQLKEIILRDECFLSLRLQFELKTSSFIGRLVRDLQMPKGTLIAIIHRNGEIIFPTGSTLLEEGDRLTIIGEPVEIQNLNQKYGKK